MFAGGVGVARRKPGDKVDDRGTRVWADAMTVVFLAGAVVVAIYVPRAAIPLPAWWTFTLGLVLVTLGAAGRWWAARTLGRFFTQSVTICEGHQVIASGPYRFVRHPGYAGMLILMIGLGLTLANWLSTLLVFIGFLAGHVPRIKVEEAVLEENLGDEYRNYERARKRLIPGIW